MPDERLRDALVHERARAQAAVGALERRHGTISFTGRPFTAAQLTTHVRSEAALHRWDLVGDDAVGDGLLAQPELTRHAVEILDTLPVLTETPRSRARLADVSGLRIVLRAPGEPDVVFVADTDDGTCELVTGGPCRGDVVLTCEPAARLLTLWGRWPGGARSASRRATRGTGRTPRPCSGPPCRLLRADRARRRPDAGCWSACGDALVRWWSPTCANRWPPCTGG